MQTPTLNQEKAVVPKTAPKAVKTQSNCKDYKLSVSQMKSHELHREFESTSSLAEHVTGQIYAFWAGRRNIVRAQMTKKGLSPINS